MGMRLLALLAIPMLVVGCGGNNDRLKLSGERESIVQDVTTIEPDIDLLNTKLKLPAVSKKSEWPQVGGYADHKARHAPLPARVTLAWKKSIMPSIDSDEGLVNPPIVADGKIYFMTPENEVISLDAWSGDKLWTRKLLNKKNRGISISGGLAFEEGVLFATTSSGQVVALDSVAGDEIWRSTVSAPVRAAPTVAGGRVFVVSHDNRLHTFRASDGKLLWSHSGIEENLSILGGAAPAVSECVVVVAYSSGEVYALRVKDGNYLWHDALSVRAAYDPLANITDILAAPVIADGAVYTANVSGQMVVFLLENGRKIWKQDFSARSTPVVIGNAIFIITTNNQMLAVHRTTGKIKWVMDLGKNSLSDKDKLVDWYGPVLAGDRLLAVSSDGYAVSVSPYDGKKLSLVKLKGNASVPPVVANEMLYFLTDEGRMIAYD